MSQPVVMLVDDEVQFVKTMAKRLARKDLEIISAHSGYEAIEKLEADDRVDVVILDVKMPGMNGLDALREIKKARPLVEVIMLTGHATVETGIKGMKLGAFDYLLKPCDIENLLEKVNEAVARKNRHEQKIEQARIRELGSSRESAES